MSEQRMVTDEEIIALAASTETDMMCTVHRYPDGELCVEWSQQAILEFARKLLALVAQ